jgi:hypothetical protein
MKRRNFVAGLLTAGGFTTLNSPKAINFAALAPLEDPAKISRVLVMFKCHLDVGFLNTQAAILRLYFDHHFPNAMKIAEKQNRQGDDRYLWTTGSWLLYEYLEQASSETRKQVEQAIAANQLAWHALPFTWQTELLDNSMVAGSLGFSKSLDRRFGRTTTGAKMTDVPGHTLGLIAPLAENGVTFLHIGVNSASTMPEVSPIFRWQDSDGLELTVMYHKDYGGTCVIPGADFAVAIEVRDDNTGPHTSEEIAAIYKKLGNSFPNAKITPASLSNIAQAIVPFRSHLPVFTQEIGDTWIHGVPSDPIKISRYRELARLRGEWLNNGKIISGEATDLGLLRHLTLAVEHTGGVDTKLFLDYDHYKPADLAKVLSLPGYRAMTTSWAEKRQNIDDSIGSLPTRLRSEALERLQTLQPKEPSVANLKPHNHSTEIDTRHFVVAIDPQTGSIRGLREKATKQVWATAQNSLALFSYQTFSKQDFDRFIASYIHSTEDWAFKDFGKPNIDHFGAQSRDWAPSLQHLWSGAESSAHRIVVELKIIDNVSEKLGTVAWPQKMFLQLVFPHSEPTVQIEFTWFAKAANRLPEAAWLSFFPTASVDSKWTLQKSSLLISPLNVVPGGNRHMHAVTKEIGCSAPEGNFVISSLDAPVVALGIKSPIFFTRDQPELSKGLHVCLHNNTWGTNYPQWFGEDMLFRFNLRSNSQPS